MPSPKCPIPRLQQNPNTSLRAKPRVLCASLDPRAQSPRALPYTLVRRAKPNSEGASVKDRNYHLQFQLPAELIAKVIAIEGSNY